MPHSMAGLKGVGARGGAGTHGGDPRRRPHALGVDDARAAEWHAPGIDAPAPEVKESWR